MLKNVTELTGFTLAGTDGELGRIDDVYFDDEQWSIRYFVVNTGGWLTGRQVLIPPLAIGAINWADKTVQVNLTQEQIRKSPDIDTAKPVSRQHETELHEHYGYPFYWGGGFAAASMVFPTIYEMQVDADLSPREEAARKEQEKVNADQHLRSAKEVEGYVIHARDGNLGHVEDFVFDTENWAIHSMVVDPRNWWPGKHVVVSRDQIEQVSWEEGSVTVSLTKDAVEHSPEYVPEQVVTVQQVHNPFRDGS